MKTAAERTQKCIEWRQARESEERFSKVITGGLIFIGMLGVLSIAFLYLLP